MASELLRRAEDSLRNKNWPQVYSLANELLKIDDEREWGHYFLGLAEMARGQVQPAINAFKRASLINPEMFQAILEASEIDQKLGRHADAVQGVRRALENDVNSAPYLNKAGNILSRAGLHAEAEPVFERAFDQDRENLTSKINLAGAKAKIGALDEARRLYLDILKSLPSHQRLHYELAKLGRASNKDHIDQMETLLASVPNDDAKNIFALFTLGKEYEDLQEWATAFGYYKRGNNAASKTASEQGYDVQSDIDALKAFQKSFSQEHCQSGRKITTESSTPIFIVGLPRSGTTLLEKIITGHEQIETIDESFFLENAVKNYCKLSQRQSLGAHQIQSLAAGNDTAEICENYLKWSEYRRTGKPFFVEKYPMNFQYLGVIARHMPSAKILYMTRAPMDVCFALYKQPHFRFSFELSGLRSYHAAFAKLTDHWRDVLGDRICFVAYEDLVNKPGVTTQSVMKFLDMDYFPELLDFYKRRDASASASSAQIREKIYSSSIGRWRKFENHLTALIRSR